MIYYILAPRFLFSANWSCEPSQWAALYFVFGSRPGTYGASHLSGLVCQTLVSREWCPSRMPPSEEYEPPGNPLKYEFNSTPWYNRSPIPPWGVPGIGYQFGSAFRFGNRGSYSVEVDFIEEGGREVWRLNSAGKMNCGCLEKKMVAPGQWVCERELYYPKRGEYTFQGERKLTGLQENPLGGMGFPQLLTRSVFSFEEHSNLVNPPSLQALLPYKGGSDIYLFQYPDTKMADVPLSQLLSVEVVQQRDEDNPLYLGNFLGHTFSEQVLLNLFYRAWDMFGPYAFPLPRGEGIWIMTISKCLKDKKRIEKRAGNSLALLQDVANLPIWEYKARWYLGNNRQKETIIPKMSSTSFIWFLYPYLSPRGDFGAYLYELDYFPLFMKPADLGLSEGIFLPSGRKSQYPAGSGKVPDPNSLIFFPPKDYPSYLHYYGRDALLSYMIAHPNVKHRRFSQCYSVIPPYPTLPIGKPSPGGKVYNWHLSGNFLMIDLDQNGEWRSFEYNGVPISEGARDVSLPPPDVLKEKLGEAGKDCVFLSFLHRPEMPEVILFWFTPEDPKFPYIFDAYLSHLYSVLVGYPYLRNAYLPWEFCLTPQDPRPISWGDLKMLVWRKGRGVVARKNWGRYPIQYLFPAIDQGTGYVYLPLMSDMEGDGGGKFKLFVFKRNDWSGEVYELG